MSSIPKISHSNSADFIIGAGFPRTGTMSLKHAIEHLRGTQCYHMIEFVRQSSHIAFWEKAFAQKDVSWTDFLKDCSGIVDFPGSLFVEQLLKAYPNAKVILTIRDEEQWFESMKSTVLATRKKNTDVPPELKNIMKNLASMRELIWDRHFEGRQLEPDFMIAQYRKHNQKVKQLVPPKQLLEMEISEGWNPLVEFLGGTPSMDFPNVNKRDEFHEMLRGEIQSLVL